MFKITRDHVKLFHFILYNDKEIVIKDKLFIDDEIKIKENKCELFDDIDHQIFNDSKIFSVNINNNYTYLFKNRYINLSYPLVIDKVKYPLNYIEKTFFEKLEYYKKLYNPHKVLDKVKRNLPIDDEDAKLIESFYTSKIIIMSLINAINIYNLIPDKLKKDREIIYHLIEYRPEYYSELDYKIRKNEDIAISVIKRCNKNVFYYVPCELMNKKNFVMKIIKTEELYRNLPILLKSDMEIIKLSLSYFPENVKYVPPKIKKNPKIYSYILKKSNINLDYIPFEFRNKYIIKKKIYKNDPHLLLKNKEDLNNVDLVRYILNKKPWFENFLSSKIKNKMFI